MKQYKQVKSEEIIIYNTKRFTINAMLITKVRIKDIHTIHQ